MPYCGHGRPIPSGCSECDYLHAFRAGQPSDALYRAREVPLEERVRPMPALRVDEVARRTSRWPRWIAEGMRG